MRGSALLVVLLAALLAPAPAAAMVYVPVDLPTLVADARAIVVGRVAVVAPRWTDGRRGIETLVTIEVAESCKGGAVREVTVALPGGQMGRYRTVMPGVPRLAEGDEVVLFIAGQGAELPHVVGLGQGVFRVMTDRATGMRFVLPEIVSAAAAAGVPVSRGELSRRPVRLEAFTDEIRRLASGAAR